MVAEIRGTLVCYVWCGFGNNQNTCETKKGGGDHGGGGLFKTYVIFIEMLKRWVGTHGGEWFWRFTSDMFFWE